MSDAPKLKTLETYRGTPIVEVSYETPVLLDSGVHTEQLRALKDFPADRIAAVIDYRHISCASNYSAAQQSSLLSSPEFSCLREKIVGLVRYHAASLTTLVSTLGASALLQWGPSHFAPDRDAALRAIRRSLDRQLQLEPEPTL